ncbi:hypothetical protein RM549_11785 [Salegentibacter sp. F188]|uniref:Uncharacterized protein n=1 Tax=Autumnicola patrickiae TaxID=3075591 RepID=A0ABU3E3A5_9FLAO|nr:hypothetical protein [Salegentibacter sp. F188]MDT0690469.1 hypothetical protein [Salegentibacter sp. F188]
MSKITLKIIFMLLLVFSFSKANAQVSVSYFGNANISKVGVAYDFNEKLWTELRILSGTDLQNFTAEAVLNYNFLRREKYNAYVGGGVVVNVFNGFVVPLGVSFSPFESLKNFSLHVELQPMYEVDFADVYIYGYGGIRYKFN